MTNYSLAVCDPLFGWLLLVQSLEGPEWLALYHLKYIDSKQKLLTAHVSYVMYMYRNHLIV